MNDETLLNWCMRNTQAEYVQLHVRPLNPQSLWRVQQVSLRHNAILCLLFACGSGIQEFRWRVPLGFEHSVRLSLASSIQSF